MTQIKVINSSYADIDSNIISSSLKNKTKKEEGIQCLIKY
jgi:hypothetical protein